MSHLFAFLERLLKIVARYNLKVSLEFESLRALLEQLLKHLSKVRYLHCFALLLKIQLLYSGWRQFGRSGSLL